MLPPLPPTPPVDLQGLFALYDTARGALGRLDSVTSVLPSTPLILYMYMRKEALMSRGPPITIQSASKELKLSLPTVGGSLEHLVDLGSCAR